MGISLSGGKTVSGEKTAEDNTATSATDAQAQKAIEIVKKNQNFQKLLPQENGTPAIIAGPRTGFPEVYVVHVEWPQGHAYEWYIDFRKRPPSVDGNYSVTSIYNGGFTPAQDARANRAIQLVKSDFNAGFEESTRGYNSVYGDPKITAGPEEGFPDVYVVQAVWYSGSGFRWFVDFGNNPPKVSVPYSTN